MSSGLIESTDGYSYEDSHRSQIFQGPFRLHQTPSLSENHRSTAAPNISVFSLQVENHRASGDLTQLEHEIDATLNKQKFKDPFHISKHGGNADQNDLVELTSPVNTWDALHKQNGALTPFFSERPASATDYLIQEYRRGEAIRLDQDVVVKCLKELLIGNNSQLFYYIHEKQAFRSTCAEKLRFMSCTQKTTQGIIDFCLNTGTRIRRLHYTTGIIGQQEPSPDRAVLDAFAKCIDRIVQSIEQFAERHFASVRHPLQLVQVFDKPEKLVTMLTTILGCADTSKVPHLAGGSLPTPVKLLNILFERTRIFQSSNAALFRLTRIIFERTCFPWLSELERVIFVAASDLYMRRPSEIFKEYLFLVYSTDLGMVVVDKSKVPQFFGSRFAHMTAEIVNCLIIAHRNSLQGTVSLQHSYRAQLRWHWSEVVPSLTGKHRLSPQPTSRFKRPKKFGPEGESRFDLTIEETPPFDEVESSTNNILYGTGSLTQEEPPMSIVPKLSFGQAMNVQWEQANKLVFDQLNGSQSLLDHLHLIGNIYFLRCGELAILVETAIFDGVGLDSIGIDKPWTISLGQINYYLSPLIEQVSDRFVGVEAAVAAGGFLNFGYSRQVVPQLHAGHIRATDSTILLRYNIPEPLNMIITREIVGNLDIIFAHLLRVIRLVHELKKRRYKQRYTVASPKIRSFILGYAKYVEQVVDSHWNDVCKSIAEDMELYQSRVSAKGLSDRILQTTMKIIDDSLAQSLKIQCIGQAVLDGEEDACEQLIQKYVCMTKHSHAAEKFVERALGKCKQAQEQVTK